MKKISLLVIVSVLASGNGFGQISHDKQISLQLDSLVSDRVS